MKKSDLEKITIDESGWETLFFHKESKTYWEQTYSNSEYHGGGSPVLKKIELTEKIKKKYKIE